MPESKKQEGLKIRIRLKAYDHRVIDQSAKQIVEIEDIDIFFPVNKEG